MSKRITQLQVATNKTITPNDLIVGAGLDGVIMKNFKLTIGNFCNYFNATSIYKLRPHSFNLGAVIDGNLVAASSYVTNQTYDISDISSLTFDIYGRVTNLEKTSGINKETENIVGNIKTTKPGEEWTGYFDNSVVGTVTGGTITSWANLFAKSYAGFKKTIITYTQARNDTTGNNTFDVCQHKLYIYWGALETVGDDTGRSCKACAIGQYPSAVGPAEQPYNQKTYIINNLSESIYYWTGTPIRFERNSNEGHGHSSEYPVLFDIDIFDQKINKLPLPCYLGKGQETCSISMTVESFV